METDKKLIADTAFKHLSELKEKLRNITGPDKSVSLESLKESLTNLRDECRALDFEEQVDVLEGLESVIDSMINNKMTESSELFELIVSGVDHTEKVLQIKGVMKRDLSKSLGATMQNLSDDFSILGKKKAKKGEEKSKSEETEKDSDSTIVNFATGRKAKKPNKNEVNEQPSEKEELANSSLKEESPAKAETVKSEDQVEAVEESITEKDITVEETIVPEKQANESNEVKSMEETEDAVNPVEEEIAETTQAETNQAQEASIERKKDQIRLTELNIQSIEETKRKIDEQLMEKDTVEVVAENINTIDLSYLQLILSARKTEGKKHVSFEFEGNVGENLKLLLNNTGFPGVV